MKPQTNGTIRVGARKGFDRVDQITERLKDTEFPVELALPWRYELWQPAEARYDCMLRTLMDLPLDIISVHATQGWITKDTFLSWGPKTCELAQKLGAACVTVHPNRSKSSRKEEQDIALRHLHKVQNEHSITISIETFGGKNRVLTPDEIMQLGLPMTLDTSHIHEDARIKEIIRHHHENIPVIHLSGRNAREQHLPVDAFCLDIVEDLLGLGWSGNLVLEYGAEYRSHLPADIRKIRSVVGSHGS